MNAVLLSFSLNCVEINEASSVGRVCVLLARGSI